MRSGELKHTVVLQAFTENQDANGDPVREYYNVGTFRASIEPLTGREAVYAGDQTLGEMDTRIRCRWSPVTKGITQAHRLVHQGTIFNIIAVALKNMAQEEMEIRCKSGINNG